MERQIGEIFQYNGVKLEVAEATECCVGCYFLNKKDVQCGDLKSDIIDFCCAFNRIDRNQVIYKKVE